MPLDLPATFDNADPDHAATLPIVARADLDEPRAQELLDRVFAVDWDALEDAYGAASEIPALLAAVVVGDDATRAVAWWNLWGTVWHQGTVYSASVPAARALAGVARDPAHPDRAEALHLLRELAGGEGTQEREVGDAVADALAPLLATWAGEPGRVQRALLWVLSASPALREAHPELVAAVLPDEHRGAWVLAVSGDWESDEEYDAYCDLEAWACEG